MIKILFECKDYLVVEKSAGIVVHPSNTSKEPTLVDDIKSKIDLAGLDSERPGIVHRIDKDTSGLLLVARNKNAYDYFVNLFKKRKIEKHYFALVKGILRHKKAVIDSPISRDLKNRTKMNISAQVDSKNAITVYEVVSEYKTNIGCVSLLDVSIKTGRTHQIRVHMKAIGHPVVMDSVYGDKSFNKSFFERFGLARQFLHAYMLKFKGPDLKLKTFKSNLPEDLKSVILLFS